MRKADLTHQITFSSLANFNYYSSISSSFYQIHLFNLNVNKQPLLNYNKKLVWLVAIASLVRIILAATQELSNVEAYYWAWAIKPQWNYFDHPPMVAWLIRLTTANLTLHNEVFVRLGAVISSAICTWLIYKIGKIIANEQAGWFAALLYTTSIYSGLNIAAYILPDSPQMIFWLAAILQLVKIVNPDGGPNRNKLRWILFGFFSGLCIMSKIHGVFLWVGAGIYFIGFNRAELRNKYLYAGLAVTLIIISPILIWNVQNHFVTLAFHGSRVTFSGGHVESGRFLKQIFEFIFSTGPIQFVLIVIAISKVVKDTLPIPKSVARLVLCCGLPLVLILTVLALYREVMPHWPGPGFSTLLILPAAVFDGRAKAIRKIAGFAIAYALVIALAQDLSINYFPGTLSAEKGGMKTGTDDATLDMYGWEMAAAKFDSLYRDDVARRVMPSGAPLVVNDWLSAAHISYYILPVTGQESYGIGSPFDLHQYYWMNRHKKPLTKGGDAYYVIPSNLFSWDKFNKITAHFRDYNYGLIFPQYRSGAICREFYIIRLYGYEPEARQNKTLTDTTTGMPTLVPRDTSVLQH